MPKKVHPSFRRLSEWEKVEVLREVLTLPVSARGEGLCLYLPKDFCTTHGFLSGDRLTVRMLDHYRKLREEE
jgi:hypothetical protein